MSFWKGITALLDNLPEAYFIFENEHLAYANPLAKALAGDRTEAAKILGFRLPETQQTMEDSRLGNMKGTLWIYPLEGMGEEKAVLLRFCHDKASSGAMEKLLCAVGGQLRESMSIIAMAVDLLLPQIEEQKDPKASQYLAMLCQHQRRVQRLAGNIDSFCTMKEHKTQADMKKLDLVELCETMVQHFSGLCTAKKRALTFSCEEKTLYTLGDRDKLRRMLLNLLSNSLRSTAEDGQISLRLGLTADGTRIQIVVTDDGAGMTPEALDRVFGSMDKTPDPDGPGSGLGLGLPIANGIAKLHGGTLMVESRPGKGTKVIVTLRKWPDSELKLHEPGLPYGSSAQWMLLTELSDVLSYEDFMPQFLD